MKMKKSHKPSLDFVIPVFNPVKGWEIDVIESLDQISMQYPELNINPVIINDGSLNDIEPSIDQIRKKFKKVTYLYHPENKGKGASIRKGLGESNSEFSLFIDADIPYTYSSIKSVIDHIFHNNNIDVVIGVRDQSYNEKLKGRRKILSSLLMNINKHLFHLKTYDTQAGLKVMNELGRKSLLQTKANRFLFDLEFILLCKKNNLHIQTHIVKAKSNMSSSSLSLGTLIKEIPSFMQILKIYISTII